MPALNKPGRINLTDLPTEKAIEAGETDVLVVGGGIAGLAAAWAASQEGCRVILAEREGFLGGDATASLVTILMSNHTQHPCAPDPGDARLFPCDHGDGRTAEAGFYQFFVDRLVRAGGALRPSRATGFTLALDPEIFKITAMKVMEEANVKLLLYATASGVIGGSSARGVVFETKSGPLILRAKTIVDCTGDGDVCALAGARFALGREKDGLTQPVTLFFMLEGVDRQKFEAYCKEHPNDWEDVFGLTELIEEAEKAGDLDLKRENILMFGTPYKDKIIVDSTRVPGVNPLDAWDLTRAAITSFHQMEELLSFFRKYVPGFKDCAIEQSGPTLYIRESRRIAGDYVLTADDIIEGRKFPDVVACGAYCIDLHNPAGSGTYVRHLPPGVTYDIPLRCLIPKDTENLLVADRAISGTHVALASYRVLPIASATGHAAGVCAALAAKQGKSPRQVDVKEVQEALLKQKAVLGEVKTGEKKKTEEAEFNKAMATAR